MNKKAVSPLVATILLIVFAMILGVIVMNVGASYLASGEQKAAEDGADVLGIIDRCVSSGAITEEEGIFLAGSLR